MTVISRKLTIRGLRCSIFLVSTQLKRSIKRLNDRLAERDNHFDMDNHFFIRVLIVLINNSF